MALALALFFGAYLVWLRFSPAPAKPGAILQAVTSPKIADMEKRAVTPKRLMVFTPKAEAVKKLKLPPEQAGNAQEEVFEATETPATRYGSTAVTFLNLSTGHPRTVIQVKEAPWFRFEQGNTTGVEYGIGSGGRYFQGDYQRDICSIKGVVVQGKVSVTSYPGETTAQAGVRAEYRWRSICRRRQIDNLELVTEMVTEIGRGFGITAKPPFLLPFQRDRSLSLLRVNYFAAGATTGASTGAASFFTAFLAAFFAFFAFFAFLTGAFSSFFTSAAGAAGAGATSAAKTTPAKATATRAATMEDITFFIWNS